jgi:amidohydrolase
MLEHVHVDTVDGVVVVRIDRPPANALAPKLLAEGVELIGTLRALDADDRRTIHEKVRTIAQNVAAGMGASVEVKIPYSMSYPVTFNNPALTAQMVPVLEAVAGPGKLQLLPPMTGAEDFSFIAEKIPSFYITLGGRPANVPKAQAPDHHTPDFFIDEGGLGLGVRALTAMALHYLQTHQRTTVGNRQQPR